jgi:hypothetical protein
MGEMFVCATPLGKRTNKGFSDKTKDSYPMVYASAYCMRWALLVTIPPRAAMIAMSYAQTFLITDAINYLETPREKRNVNHAYGLIAASAIIYAGNAVGTLSPISSGEKITLHRS